MADAVSTAAGQDTPQVGGDKGRRQSGLVSACLGALAGLVLLAATAWGVGVITGRPISLPSGAAGTDGPSAPAGPPAADPDGEQPPREFAVLVGGDLLFDLEPGKILAAEGPTALMRGWVNLRWRGDVNLGLANLECPLSERGEPLPGKRFLFRGHPEQGAEALRWVGVDGVSLANNHILDYGVEAMLDTFAALDAARIAWAGAGVDEASAYAPVLYDCDGLVVAFLAFGDLAPVPPAYYELWTAGPGKPGTATLRPRQKLLDAISGAREVAHVVIVSFHWGYEYQEAGIEQQQLGRAAIDAGADLVFGHHPHVPQPVEIYRGRPILYSMGNLVFHPFQPRARDMLAAIVRFAPDEGSAEGRYAPVTVELHPLYNDGGRTITSTGEQAAGLLANLAARSRLFGTHFEQGDNMLRLELR